MKHAIILLLSLLCSTVSVGQQFLFPITHGFHDAEQVDGVLNIVDDEIDIGWDMGARSTAGFLFRELPFEKDATFIQAYLVLTVEDARTTPLALTVALENSVNPFDFDSVDVDSRVMSSNQLTWTVDSAEALESIRTIDIAPLINDHIARDDWEPYKNLCILITPASEESDSVRNELEVFSYNQINADYFPTLEIFTTDSAGLLPLNTHSMTTHSKRIRLYPNPTRGQVTIQSESGLIQRIEVFSNDGRLIKEQMVQNRTITLRPEAFSTPGHYWIRVTNEEGVQVKPLMVTH